ncbi:unnamed protein product [Cutaneotrichosporon oleaginosum]
MHALPALSPPRRCDKWRPATNAPLATSGDQPARRDQHTSHPLIHLTSAPRLLHVPLRDRMTAPVPPFPPPKTGSGIGRPAQAQGGGDAARAASQPPSERAQGPTLIYTASMRTPGRSPHEHRGAEVMDECLMSHTTRAGASYPLMRQGLGITLGRRQAAVIPRADVPPNAVATYTKIAPQRQIIAACIDITITGRRLEQLSSPAHCCLRLLRRSYTRTLRGGRSAFLPCSYGCVSESPVAHAVVGWYPLSSLTFAVARRSIIITTPMPNAMKPHDPRCSLVDASALTEGTAPSNSKYFQVWHRAASGILARPRTADLPASPTCRWPHHIFSSLLRIPHLESSHTVTPVVPLLSRPRSSSHANAIAARIIQTARACGRQDVNGAGAGQTQYFEGALADPDGDVLIRFRYMRPYATLSTWAGTRMTAARSGASEATYVDTQQRGGHAQHLDVWHDEGLG